MNKILIKICNDSEFSFDVCGFILGVKDFSFGFGKVFSIDEINKIRKKYKNKKIFACLNCFVFNDILDNYKKMLSMLDNLKLDGIIVSDVSALLLNLKTDIILDQLHLNNSYLTINHYEKNGVSGIYLTNDITLDEINEIRCNSKCLLFKDVFCIPHLSSSRRSLLTNYFTHFNIKNINDNACYIKEKKSNDYYLINEDNNITSIYSSVMNLLEYVDKIKVDFFVINSYLIDNDIKDVIDAYLNDDKNKVCYINEKYNANDFFINKKTIYKVKDN